MLRFRGSILAHLLSSPATSPVSSFQRLLSAAAPRLSPNPSFAVEEYLVVNCGLTQPQAVKASAKLSHLKSPKNADAVLAFLAGIGLSSADVAAAIAQDPQLLCAKVARAEAVGVRRGSGMFRHALQAVAMLSEEEIAVKVEHLKNTFSWSDAEVGVAVCKAPTLLMKSKESLQNRSKFLISDMGLAPAYIAQRSSILTYSLEGRIRPRYYVLKFLQENGFDRDYYSAAVVTEKVFLEKYISPHKEAAPYLGEDYASSCRGEVPPRFMFA